jgi:hypothetical protein
VRDLVNQSLDVVDVSTWTGDPLNASFIFGQLRLLHETITEARHMLKGENDNVQGKWWETSVEDNVSHSTLQAPGIDFGADWTTRFSTLRCHQISRSTSLLRTRHLCSI